MTIETHQIDNIKIAEVLSEVKIIDSIDDGLSLLGDLYYPNSADVVILHFS